jgi:hypothetical protein
MADELALALRTTPALCAAGLLEEVSLAATTQYQQRFNDDPQEQLNTLSIPYHEQ